MANVFQGLHIELNQEYYPFMTTWLSEKGLLLALFVVFLAWLLIWHFKSNFVLAMFVAAGIGLVMGVLRLIGNMRAKRRS
jgi:hypothetical protein